MKKNIKQYLLDKHGEDFCFAVCHNPDDVQYEYYNTLFTDTEWDLNSLLKPCEGYEGQYSVSKYGIVWSHKRNKALKACGDKDNYQIVSLSFEGKTKSEYVHRLVAKAWVPNPDNLSVVNHKDYHKDHNYADNLEWCTQRYNLEYSNVWETSKKTSKPVYCVELDKTFPSIYSAAKEFNLQPTSIWGVCTGRQLTAGKYRWRYV